MTRLVILLALAIAMPARAHSGGTDASGCHKQNGVRHCHSSSPSSGGTTTGASSSSGPARPLTGGEITALVTVTVLAIAGGAWLCLRARKEGDEGIAIVPSIDTSGVGLALFGRF